MRKCSTCKKRIALGGEEFGSEIYCGEKCRKSGLLAASKEFLTEDIVKLHLEDVHSGACPKCGGEGPNDMQWHYTIWSLIVLTSHKDIPEVCCQKCGIKKKIGGLFFSGLFGWWGIPFGLLLTPIQVVRNCISFFYFPKKDKISKKMDEAIRLELGAEALLEKEKSEFQPAVGDNA